MIDVRIKTDETGSPKASENQLSKNSGLVFTLDEMKETLTKVAFDWFSSDMSDDTDERKKVGKCLNQFNQVILYFENDVNPFSAEISALLIEETFINLVLDWFSANLSQDPEERSRVSGCMGQLKQLLRIWRVL